MSGGQKRRPLLIVEDDLALQKQMKWAFESNETLLANDIATAIAQIRRFEPSVVTMDLGLPPQPNDATAGFELLNASCSIRDLFVPGKERMALGADFHLDSFLCRTNDKLRPASTGRLRCRKIFWVNIGLHRFVL